jgi:hypothetical protein
VSALISIKREKPAALTSTHAHRYDPAMRGDVATYDAALLRLGLLKGLEQQSQ